MSHNSDSHFVEDLMENIPKFQYGMDVNPKFTQGCKGFEYTSQLTAFDMLQVQMVHGWLLDPHSDETLCEAIGSKSYNEIVEVVVRGQSLSAELEQVRAQLQSIPSDELQKRVADLETTVQQGQLLREFLDAHSSQLTIYGLQVLHEELKEGDVSVFFRNNHFSTITRRGESLYLLVTDLGYAHSPGVVWEKLDMVDGDTELVNSDFVVPGTQPADIDTQVAMSLSLKKRLKINGPVDLSAEEGDLIAAATEASLRTYNGLDKDEAPQAKMTPEEAEDADMAKATMMEEMDRLMALQLQDQLDQNDDAGYHLAQALQDAENQRVYELRSTTRKPKRKPHPSMEGQNACVIS